MHKTLLTFINEKRIVRVMKGVSRKQSRRGIGRNRFGLQKRKYYKNNDWNP